MKFLFFLLCGIFIKRYKWFFVDVELDDGIIVIVYCLNIGVMIGCVVFGYIVFLSEFINFNWKFKYIWELV